MKEKRFTTRMYFFEGINKYSTQMRQKLPHGRFLDREPGCAAVSSQSLDSIHNEVSKERTGGDWVTCDESCGKTGIMGGDCLGDRDKIAAVCPEAASLN